MSSVGIVGQPFARYRLPRIVDRRPIGREAGARRVRAVPHSRRRNRRVDDDEPDAPSSGFTRSREELAWRLARIEGQVRGLQRMIGEDRACSDVLTQRGGAGGARQGRTRVARRPRATHAARRRVRAGGQRDPRCGRSASARPLSGADAARSAPALQVDASPVSEKAWAHRSSSRSIATSMGTADSVAPLRCSTSPSRRSLATLSSTSKSSRQPHDSANQPSIAESSSVIVSERSAVRRKYQPSSASLTSDS